MASLDDLSPFSQIQLIAFDLDGTLLKAPDGTPGVYIKHLRGSAKSFGARITLATGRTLKGAQNTLLALGDLGAMPIILYNGSLVIEPGMGKVISHRLIDTKAANEVLSAACAHKAEIFIYMVSVENLQLNQGLESWETVNYVGKATLPSREYNGMPVVKLATNEIGVPVTAMLILLDPKEDSKPLKLALQLIKGISITSSGSQYIEIRPEGSSKATAMEDLCRSLSLQRTDVLAVGDNDNDVELLEWAGIGVAVKGASAAAVAASDYISLFGAEQAAINVLNLVRHAKRLNRTKR